MGDVTVAEGFRRRTNLARLLFHSALMEGDKSQPMSSLWPGRLRGSVEVPRGGPGETKKSKGPILIRGVVHPAS